MSRLSESVIIRHNWDVATRNGTLLIHIILSWNKQNSKQVLYETFSQQNFPNVKKRKCVCYNLMKSFVFIPTYRCSIRAYLKIMLQERFLKLAKKK